MAGELRTRNYCIHIHDPSYLHLEYSIRVKFREGESLELLQILQFNCCGLANIAVIASERSE
jgi:hypothetical protein